MHKIWKFPVAKRQHLTGSRFTLDIPAHAKILCVEVQKVHPESRIDSIEDVPVVYALCADGDPKTQRKFIFHATGDNFDMPGPYIGTIQIANGLVFHLFEIFP